MTSTEALIRQYVEAQIAENDGDTIPLWEAIRDAVHPAETRALGRAMCARHDALTDGPYRIGAERCDPRLTAIAAGVGYDAA